MGPFIATALRGANLAAPALPHWPSPDRILRARGTARMAERCKAWLRHWLSQPHRAPLLAVLARHPAWSGLFTRDPRYAHCALSHFVDRRRDMKRRFEALALDLGAAAEAFGGDIAERLARREPVRLWSLDADTHLCLALNDMSYHEGLWALSLRDTAGARLYYLSFSFLGRGALLVPTLQGPGGCSDTARESIRLLTKRAEGLRPPALLLAALRALADGWQVSRLAGIAPAHHVKGRWNLRGKRLRFDYATFWAEQGGRLDVDGHWQLPLRLAPRDLGEIPSNKRAMYRRREAMLDEMRRSVARALAADLPAAASDDQRAPCHHSTAAAASTITP